jgi:hypothetical protein
MASCANCSARLPFDTNLIQLVLRVGGVVS